MSKQISTYGVAITNQCRDYQRAVLHDKVHEVVGVMIDLVDLCVPHLLILTFEVQSRIRE